MFWQEVCHTGLSFTVPQPGTSPRGEQRGRGESSRQRESSGAEGRAAGQWESSGANGGGKRVDQESWDMAHRYLQLRVESSGAEGGAAATGPARRRRHEGRALAGGYGTAVRRHGGALASGESGNY